MDLLARQSFDRRKHARRHCQITLSSRVGVQRATVTASDISSTGARLVMPAEFARSREIILSGPASKGGAVRAQIVWVRPQEDGQVLAGVHFLEKSTRIYSSWASLYLGAAAKTPSVVCQLSVTLKAPGWPEPQEAVVRLLEADGVTLECPRYLHLAARFHFELPYEGGHKKLRLQCQVVQSRKRNSHYLVTAQFVLNEKARERQLLTNILRQMAKEDS